MEILILGLTVMTQTIEKKRTVKLINMIHMLCICGPVAGF